MSDVQEKMKSWLPKRLQAWGILKTRLTKDDSTLLAWDLTKFCLQLFAEIFTGHQLTSEQVCGVSACVVCVCVSECVCI